MVPLALLDTLNCALQGQHAVPTHLILERHAPSTHSGVSQHHIPSHVDPANEGVQPNEGPCHRAHGTGALHLHFQQQLAISMHPQAQQQLLGLMEDASTTHPKSPTHRSNDPSPHTQDSPSSHKMGLLPLLSTKQPGPPRIMSGEFDRAAVAAVAAAGAASASVDPRRGISLGESGPASPPKFTPSHQAVLKGLYFKMSNGLSVGLTGAGLWGPVDLAAAMTHTFSVQPAYTALGAWGLPLQGLARTPTSFSASSSQLGSGFGGLSCGAAAHQDSANASSTQYQSPFRVLCDVSVPQHIGRCVSVHTNVRITNATSIDLAIADIAAVRPDETRAVLSPPADSTGMLNLSPGQHAWLPAPWLLRRASPAQLCLQALPSSGAAVQPDAWSVAVDVSQLLAQLSDRLSESEERGAELSFGGRAKPTPTTSRLVRCRYWLAGQVAASRDTSPAIHVLMVASCSQGSKVSLNNMNYTYPSL